MAASRKTSAAKLLVWHQLWCGHDLLGARRLELAVGRKTPPQALSDGDWAISENTICDMRPWTLESTFAARAVPQIVVRREGRGASPLITTP